MVRILKNISQAEVILSDFKGVTLQPNETYDGLAFGETPLITSESIATALVNGNLSISDGTQELTGMQAIWLIQGTSPQYTKDGKKIITTSDRPKDHFRNYTGCGDDMTNLIRGEGELLNFSVGPQSTYTVDVKFLDDVYIKDGMMDYLDADLGCHLCVHVMAPIGVPYPVFNKTGTLDFNGVSFVPNVNNTGDYKVNNSQEVVFNKFLNKLGFVGPNGKKFITSSEPVLLYKPYFLRFIVTNPSITKTVISSVTIGLYRKLTVNV